MPNNYYLYREQFGATSNSFPLTVGWSRDERDSALVPNAGSYKRVNVDWGVAGDTRYLRTNLQYQQYCAAHASSSPSRFNAEIGYGKGLGGRPYPVFKNFYGGGLGSVRGFDQGSLGPVDVTGAYIGGNAQAQPQQRAVRARARRRQRPHAARVRLLRRRQRLGRERDDHLRQPARVGRRRA